MNREINKIKIFANENKISNEISELLQKKLLENNFIIVEENPDLAIAVGGDGSFLRMVKNNNYDSDILYVGVNAGTLGFLQEVKISDLEVFINVINNNSYKTEEVGIQETEIITEDDRSQKYYSLNDIMIREKELRTAILDLNIGGAKLERFVGDGILVATSVGSSAYNMSLGGSIVYNGLHTLQITPVAPLNNKTYRNILNPIIIPENITVEVSPDKTKPNLLIMIDGESLLIDNVKVIKTAVKNKRIKCLRLENYNFFQKINEKFLI